jgi:hypothetical protein
MIFSQDEKDAEKDRKLKGHQAIGNLRHDCRLFPSVRGRGAHQFVRFHLKRVGDPAKYRHACGNIGALDTPDVPGAQPGPLRQFLLRHLFRMTQPTQIDRHDLLEIHGDDGADTFYEAQRDAALRGLGNLRLGA